MTLKYENNLMRLQSQYPDIKTNALGMTTRTIGFLPANPFHHREDISSFSVYTKVPNSLTRPFEVS